MKLILICLMSLCSNALIANDDCPNAKEKIIKEVKNMPLKSDYIEIVARQIFTDETALTNFIGIRCYPLTNNEKNIWHCQIRQSATKFEKGKYSVNPPGVGEWILTINFLDNTYQLE